MSALTDENTKYSTDYFDQFAREVILSARTIAPIVMELVDARSVIDVGCGTGAWAREFKRCGVQQVIGVDGPWISEEHLLIPSSEFHQADLTKPLHLNRTFDLVVCLEVAEHLPKQSSRTLIDSLTKLAPIVLFSAAIPGQPGIDHINCQWPDYWAKMFAGRNYVCIDAIRRRVWDHPDVAPWYAQNTLLFVESERSRSLPLLQAEVVQTGYGALNIVHPDYYIPNLPEMKGLRGTLRLVLPALLHTGRRRWSELRHFISPNRQAASIAGVYSDDGFWYGRTVKYVDD